MRIFITRLKAAADSNAGLQRVKAWLSSERCMWIYLLPSISWKELLNRVQFETHRFRVKASPSGRLWKAGTYGFQTGRGLTKFSLCVFMAMFRFYSLGE